MKSTQEPEGLSAQDAATRLGVKLATLYAYVSRGLLTRLPGAGKNSRFDAAEVEQLAARARHAHGARHEPLVIPSALTEIDEGCVRYRGHDVVELASHARFEQVAHLLWGLDALADPSLDTAFEAPRAAVVLARALSAKLPPDTLPIERLRVSATVLGSRDPLRYQTRASAVVATARGLVAGLIEALPVLQVPPAGASLAARLWSRLCATPASPRELRALDAAMVLCADHALSPSTLAVRIAASQRADPYAVVQTGLGALSGALQGAASLAAEELLAEIEGGAGPSEVVGARLRRGERIPGFGHSLHAQGDPRAAALLDTLQRSFSRSAALTAIRSVQRVMAERALPAANIDFALAALVRCAGMLTGASEAIMATARVAGWIAHALEEYTTPSRFPWQAAYIGPRARDDARGLSRASRAGRARASTGVDPR